MRFLQIISCSLFVVAFACPTFAQVMGVLPRAPSELVRFIPTQARGWQLWHESSGPPRQAVDSYLRALQNAFEACHDNHDERIGGLVGPERQEASFTFWAAWRGNGQLLFAASSFGGLGGTMVHFSFDNQPLLASYEVRASLNELYPELESVGRSR